MRVGSTDGVGGFTMIEARDNGESSIVGGDDGATLAVEGWVGGDGVGGVGVGVEDDGEEDGARLSPFRATRGIGTGAEDEGRGSDFGPSSTKVTRLTGIDEVASGTDPKPLNGGAIVEGDSTNRPARVGSCAGIGLVLPAGRG
jgi:hypothetical protein